MPLDGITHHPKQEFERAERMMGQGVEQWIWVMDFRGYGCVLYPCLGGWVHACIAAYCIPGVTRIGM